MLQLDEFDYNKTREDIEKYTNELLKNNNLNLETKLQNYMQEILANLLGCRTYRDATLESGKNDKYYMDHYHKLGKKKLTEFFIMLEELEKQNINIDTLRFYENKNTTLLKREQVLEDSESLYLDLLSFSSIDQFLTQVINILENTPRNLQAPLRELRDNNIPDPKTYNLNRYHYLSIDLFLFMEHIGFYGIIDNSNNNYEKMRIKHQEKGIEVDAIEFIKNFRNRERKEPVIEFKNIDSTKKPSIFSRFTNKKSAEKESKIDSFYIDNFFINTKMTKDEIKKLSQTIKSKKDEINYLREALLRTHDYFKQQLQEHGVNLTDKELEQAEETYILDKILETIDVKESQKSGKTLIYSTFMAFTIAVIKANSTFIASNQSISLTPLEETAEMLLTINTNNNIKNNPQKKLTTTN